MASQKSEVLRHRGATRRQDESVVAFRRNLAATPVL
jgi:hypothetical protein